jgi:hypothetical protein
MDVSSESKLLSQIYDTRKHMDEINLLAFEEEKPEGKPN